MLVIQILIVAFAVFALARAFMQFRSGRLPFAWFLFWLVFWIAVGTVVLLPQTAQMAAQFVGVGRGVDFVIYVSIIALFYLVFRLFVKIEDVEREITRLVRKIALEETNEK